MLAALNSGTKVPADKDTIDCFRSVLNTYEMLGLAVKLGAIDERVWEQYWKKALLRDWERLKDFINEERTRYSHPTLFDDAEAIVKRWSA
nr:hypothetical protein RKHAN_00924 [Rhizobium sp. Khangiran2]